MKKVYMVTDLGPGDGGKGGVVHKLTTQFNAHTIVKVGGAQGSHGVRTAAGQSFAFSQFGCGTFEGVRTHLSRRFVIDPIGIVNEAMALRYEAGVYDPFSLLTIDESALCNTPFHGIASRIKELALRDSPRGTIGTGVGQAYRLNGSHPELSIFAHDLSSSQLRQKLEAIRDYITAELEPMLANSFLKEDEEELTRNVVLLTDSGFIEHMLEQFRLVATNCRIVDAPYFATDILGRDGVIVVESSHGILTDAYTGFHPHTSALRTLPRFTRAMFTDAGYDGQIISLGVHRAYQIRHGAGPMPTADPVMSEELLPGSNKDENRWQGKVRAGPLDLVLLRYAITASGADAYNGICLTWFDQVSKNTSWRLCNKYSGSASQHLLTPAGNIKVRTGEDAMQLAYLGELTKQLQVVTPVVEQALLPFGATRDKLFDFVAATLQEHLDVPVRMVSFGPTERDKVLK
jgi:adenylosuccinate synthase